MARMTLDDIRNSIAKKYQSFELELAEGVIELRNPLRIPKEDRAKMNKLRETLGADAPEGEEEDEDAAEERMANSFGALLAVAATPETRANVKAFCDSIADDEDRLLLLTEVMDAYMSEQQVGEA